MAADDKYYERLGPHGKTIATVHNAIWTTRAARFDATRRIRRSTALTQWGIALASAILTLRSLRPEFADQSSGVIPADERFFLTAASVVILVASVMLASSHSLEVATTLHKNAIELKSLLSRLETLAARPAADDISAEVHAVQLDNDALEASLSVNHAPIDFWLAKLRPLHREHANPAFMFTVVAWNGWILLHLFAPSIMTYVVWKVVSA